MAPIVNPRSSPFAEFMAHPNRRASIQPPVPAAQPAPIHPTQDHARRILEGLPDQVMSMDSKADAWDAYYQSRHSQELAQKLANIDLPVQVKTDLWNAKRQFSDPVPTPMDRVEQALHRMADLDPNVLESMESKPNILKSLMSSLQGEK